MSELVRVLYVEDEKDIQEVAKLALEMVGGYQVKVCSSGEQALAEAEAFAPQMILLDVMMPSMDGPTTLKALQQIASLAEVPKAFMTAKVMPSEVEQLLALGAVGVIAKPFDPMTLSEEVKAMWQKGRA